MWSKRDPNLSFLASALDYSHFRHELIANNLANAETPGYKREDVTFEDLLRSEKQQRNLLQTHDSHLPGEVRKGQLIAHEVQGTRTRLDGSNVDIEVEMAKLAANGLYYQSVSQLLNSRLMMIDRIIAQGGRS